MPSPTGGQYYPFANNAAAQQSSDPLVSPSSHHPPSDSKVGARVYRGNPAAAAQAAAAAAAAGPGSGPRSPGAGYGSRDGYGAQDPTSPRSHLLPPNTPGTAASTSSYHSNYRLPPDMAKYGTSGPDDDDDDRALRDGKDDNGSVFTARGLMNLGSLLILGCGLIMLFAGYPILSYFRTSHDSSLIANSTGQVPDVPNMFDLVDRDTPKEAYTRTGFDGKTQYQLVFSDEFNTDGRSFYPGDDPYWEAPDFYYWATQDAEWYTPDQITTSNGSLVITMDERQGHDLNFKSGMLQSWNKFCFTGGYMEAAIQLPGSPYVSGLWPAFWAMGNLGRAGYGATTDGLWPYSYDSCDVGVLPNQSFANKTPADAQLIGQYGTILSNLPGQRLSACTCPGEDHPGPTNPDGTFVGRSAPEIDVFEAQAFATTGGALSQSLQLAPFNRNYTILNTPGAYEFLQPGAQMNSYTGSALQQAISGTAPANNSAYQLTDQMFARYGVEYEPGLNGYITWLNNGQQSWRVTSAALDADARVGISARPVPQEPMYIMFNLGMSHGFQPANWAKLTFPVHMKVDYIRVYQPKNAINWGCDPKGFPTKDWINKYSEVYNNPNITFWQGEAATGGFGRPWPKQRLTQEGWQTC